MWCGAYTAKYCPPWKPRMEKEKPFRWCLPETSWTDSRNGDFGSFLNWGGSWLWSLNLSLLWEAIMHLCIRWPEVPLIQRLPWEAWKSNGIVKIHTIPARSFQCTHGEPEWSYEGPKCTIINSCPVFIQCLHISTCSYMNLLPYWPAIPSLC